MAHNRAMPMVSGSLRKTLKLVAKIALVAALVWGLEHTIRSALADLDAQGWRLSSVRPGWLVLAGACYLGGYLPSGLFWRHVLLTLGERPRLGRTLLAYYSGHLGKYVPGKAVVIVLRAALVRSEGVGLAVATASVFYETLTMMAVGAFTAGAILSVYYRDRWQLMLIAFGLMAAAGAPIVPRVFQRLARMAGIERAAPGAIGKLDHLSVRSLAAWWLAIGVGWCLMGASTWCVLQSIDYTATLPAVDEILLCTAVIALAVVAGFASFVPGGLGVRELVMLELMTPAFGGGPALVCAALSRLVSLVAEVAISSILYPVSRRVVNEARTVERA